MTEERFPVDECYVCGEDITEKGAVLAIGKYTLQDLAKKHDNSVEKLLGSEHVDFVNAATHEYFAQLPRHFNAIPKDGSIKEMLQDLEITMKAPKYRLKKVLENPPEQDIYLLLHIGCASKNIIPRQGVPLSEIDTCQKAIQITQYIGRKNTFNGLGWAKILYSLFGENPTR
jgi:hypothetical protein